MSKPEIGSVKQALENAGVEVYRTTASEIQVAERVRLHIMDSGVRVHLGDQAAVTFTARSQRSDFPHATSEDLFARVRDHVSGQAVARGYEESTSRAVDVTDPVDDSKVLDVWHEVTYARSATSVEELVDEVQWALTVDKVVAGREG